jgi:hypothetical protein
MAFSQPRFSRLLRACEGGSPDALAAQLEECLPYLEAFAPFQVRAVLKLPSLFENAMTFAGQG